MEWHGWATIRASAGVEDDKAADEAQARANRAVAALVDGAQAFGEMLDVRVLNGYFVLAFNGMRNHRASSDPVGFFESVARAAPGSYGVLYLYDFEDPHNRWERWVMRRGAVTQEEDTSLSPHVGVVEDADDRERRTTTADVPGSGSCG